MGATTLEDLRGQLAAQVNLGGELKAAAQDREFTPEETAKANGVLTEVKRLKGEIDAAAKAEGLRSAIDALDIVTDDDGPITEADVKALNERMAKVPAGGLGRQKSWGEQFTESENFKPFREKFEGKDVSAQARIDVPRVGMKVNPFTDAGANQGVPLLAPDQRGLIDMGPFQRPLVLRDLVSNGRTAQTSVRYARITGFTNAAAGVHEATTVTGTNAAGGLKPQSDVAVTAFTATVVTIAHWFAASKQSLSDIPLLRSLIDNYGRYGLAEEEEDEMIAGTGAANDQLDGFNTVSGMQTQAFDTDIFKSVRKAITKIRKNGQARPNGVLLNLEDEETIDLYRLNQGGGAGTGAWVGNGPFRTGPNSLWGLPVVSTPATPTGKAYVADFRTILFLMHEDPSVAVTDSHSDFFVRNLIALLFEERATQLIIRPTAICEVATA